MNFVGIRDMMVLKGSICDHCLGRQATHAFKGVENDRIGAAMRAAKDDAEIAELAKRNSPIITYPDCYVCGGIFARLDEMEARLLQAASTMEWSTFLVGNKIPEEAIEREEMLWSEIGMEHCEPMKREINRALGKRISLATEKEANFDNPDIILTANFKTMRAETTVSPLYIRGRYKKLARGMPQTRWPCSKCRGIGCESCNYTGKMYQESVEELIGHEILKATEGKATKFHGKGREDIDALMLGAGREFVIEIERPRVRSLELAGLEAAVNAYAKGKVEASLSAYSSKQEIVELKAATPDKTYSAVIGGESISDADMKKISETFSGLEVEQQTPQRVAHRRADMARKKTVRSVKCAPIDGSSFSAEIRAQSGTYIKELISGDDGRTKPSFSSIINKSLVCKELNVLEIMDGE